MKAITVDQFNVLANTKYTQIVHICEFLRKINITSLDLLYSKSIFDAKIDLENPNQFIIHRTNKENQLIFTIVCYSYQEFKRLIQLKDFL